MTEAWRPDGEDERRGSIGPVKVRVPAKVNLHLGVGPLRRDGYHELNTIYHAISIYDELTARRGDTLALTMEGEGTGELALDDTNLVIRAAHALAGYAGVLPHARLHLRKQIPLAGGLAGGSADAAAALVACDALWGTGLSRDELAGIAADLGSDVPFLIYGGTALGTGRGEAISPVLARPTSWHWVVAIADGGLSTPAAYRELDRLRDSGAAGTHWAPPTRCWARCVSATPGCSPGRSATIFRTPRWPCARRWPTPSRPARRPARSPGSSPAPARPVCSSPPTRPTRSGSPPS